MKSASKTRMRPGYFRALGSHVLLAVWITAWSMQASAGNKENHDELSTEERLAIAEKRIEDLERRLEQVLKSSQPPSPASLAPAEGNVEAASGDELLAGNEEPAVGEADPGPAATVPLGTVGELAYTPPLAGEGRNAPLEDENFPKSIPLFGSDLRFSFGGYAKADIIRDLSGTGDDSQFVLAAIPVNGNPQPGSYSNYQLRETRFHFDVRDSSDGRPDSRFFLEFDFFDGTNDRNPRLRHGYFQYGQLLVGQTWTTMTELRQLPVIIDFAAGDSLLGGRTKQIRWIGDEDGQPWNWSVALESFDDKSIANPYGADGLARANWPRFVGVVSKPWDGGVVTAGFAASELRFDGAETLGSATKWAYTSTLAGRLYLDKANQAYLGAGFGYSSGGVTDIITFANGGVPNAVLDENHELQLTEAWNAQIALHWPWTTRWSGNLNYAYARLTTVPTGLDPDLIREGWAIHANVMYRFDERLSAGFEYMYGYRENVDGQHGNADRLQIGIFYYF